MNNLYLILLLITNVWNPIQTINQERKIAQNRSGVKMFIFPMRRVDQNLRYLVFNFECKNAETIFFRMIAFVINKTINA